MARKEVKEERSISEDSEIEAEEFNERLDELFDGLESDY